MSDEKPMRPCVGCGQVDDHPRHTISIPGGEAIFWHMDCHRNNGCPDCTTQLAEAEGATGDELRTHLLSLTPTVTITED